jgi:hypothetical protein
VFVLLALCGTEARAEQPVFDEMPRWNDGWGVQLLQEYRRESRLLSGDAAVGTGHTEDVHLLHLQGVYTWTKNLRATLKLPFVLRARRTMPDGEGGTVVQEDRGLGDPTVALPLKSYFNLDGRSGSWTLAPQVKVPAGRRDDYDVYDRVWGAGLGAGYSTETYRYHLGVGSTFWYYPEGEPTEISLHLSLGVNVQLFGGSGHLKWKTIGLHETDGSLTLLAGPTFYWRFTDLLHGQLQWQHDFYDRQGTVDHGDGDSFRAGIAVVY